MSADLLRRAATVLRERVAAVQAGAAEPEMWFGVDELELALTHGDQAEMGDPRADADYIATMHPGVGLALADWLTTAGADLWAHGPLHCADGCDECDDDLWMPHVRRALTVARAILGGAS